MQVEGSFVAHISGALSSLPGVEGVALGGSRAQGTNRPDSDWDFAIYYRKTFNAQAVRDIGWDGQMTDVGGWGPIFNGGGNASVDGRSIDIHYRDLDLIDRIYADATKGEFTITPLLFHQAGIPSYILLAELFVNRVLVGALPRWEYPGQLRQSAARTWWFGAELTLHYAKEGHARYGRVAQCAGLLSEAACRTAHAIVASRGEWVTNEKQLLAKAGLRNIDEIIATLGREPSDLLDATDATRQLLRVAATDAGIT